MVMNTTRTLVKFNIINMIISCTLWYLYLTLLLACTKQVIRCENRHRYTQDPADRMEKCRQITGVTNVCFHTDYVTMYDRSSVYEPRFTLQIIIYHYLSARRFYRYSFHHIVAYQQVFGQMALLFLDEEALRTIFRWTHFQVHHLHYEPQGESI